MAKWLKRWKYNLRKTNLPGVYELEKGGFLIRGQVTTLGKKVQIQLVINVPTALAALNELSRRKKERAQETQAPRALPFSEFVATLLEEKAKAGEHASTTTMTKWETICRKHLFPVFGSRRIDTITHQECLIWKHSFLDSLNEGRLKPRTVNSWLRTMHVIFNAAAPRFSFSNPMTGISDYPIRGRVFTEEKPNRLEPQQALQFLVLFEERYLDHYAMLLLMLVTGARPSTVRPLRRKGPSPDYNRKTGVVYLRRSQVKGMPMDMTKTGLDQTIPLPEVVKNVINAHIDRLEASTGPMKTSNLLFPSTKGSFRARSVLDDPMKMICSKLDIPGVTPKGLRRTFKDIARSVKLDKVVEKSISGHKSDEMDFIYGTAFNSEKREALDAVIQAIGVSEDVDIDDEQEDEKEEEAVAAE